MSELSKGEDLIYDFKAACAGAYGDFVTLSDVRYRDMAERDLMNYVTALENENTRLRELVNKLISEGTYLAMFNDLVSNDYSDWQKLVDEWNGWNGNNN